MKSKLCFTIMGFGKKTDFSTGKTYDLDKTYQNIIKPVVERCGYVSIRADEIQDSGLIDKSMYALLVKAELVIADITTLNPNALYELGIRHAAKPNHTIILKDKEGKIPFDLDHNRFIIYHHLGEDVGASEAQECQARLEQVITSIQKQGGIDSPLFEYLQGLSPHSLSDQDYEQVISKLSDKEDHIFGLSEKARLLMSNSDFQNAATIWERLSQIKPEEHYFVQQQTLCTYKSEQPSKQTSLLQALAVISKIYIPEETNDPETLGLIGSIHKRLFETNGDIEVLKIAINSYKRGYTVSHNYYTGENYASCLDKLSLQTVDPEEKSYCRYASREIRKEIISTLSKKIAFENENAENKWMYATLANCNFNLGDPNSGMEWENKFLSCNPDEWEKESYFSHKPTQ